MQMTEEPPFSWIRTVAEELRQLDEKPQFGLSPPCDWELLEHYLQELLQRPSLSLSYKAKGWLSVEELWPENDKQLLPLAIVWTPIHAPAYFVTSLDALKQLMADLFGGEPASAYFSDLSLVQGFYTYLASEVLHMLEQVKYAYPLAPHLGAVTGSAEEVIPHQPAFAIDLSCSFESYTFWGRILLTEPFRSEWKAYFSHFPPPPASLALQEKLAVEVGLEVGKSTLSLQEWKKVQVGDYILLDSARYDVSKNRGSILLTMKQRPLMRGRLKEGVIKLMEYVTYEETNLSMNDHPPLEPNPPFDQEDEDESLFSSDMETEEATPPGTASLDPETLPIQLIVEVGRLRMTIKEIMALAPGNLLELNRTPEQGVDLIVGGRQVGTGELIRLGETIGVRILSL